MKATELKKEILDYILSEVQTSVMRLGINAQLSYVTRYDYHKNEILGIESTKFQTMPMMFKELMLVGNINIVDETEEQYYNEVAISLDYRYTSFNGGHNGTELGRIIFRVDKDLPKKIGHDMEKFYVRKVQSIEI